MVVVDTMLDLKSNTFLCPGRYLKLLYNDLHDFVCGGENFEVFCGLHYRAHALE